MSAPNSTRFRRPPFDWEGFGISNAETSSLEDNRLPFAGNDSQRACMLILHQFEIFPDAGRCLAVL